jgi:hypothetical protein
MSMTRRDLTKALLVVPAAAAASVCAAEQAAPPAATRAACLAATESALDASARERLAQSLVGLEQTLQVIREYPVPQGADPAWRFEAVVARRRA